MYNTCNRENASKISTTQTFNKRSGYCCEKTEESDILGKLSQRNLLYIPHKREKRNKVFHCCSFEAGKNYFS
jgi:hypothetical protein